MNDLEQPFQIKTILNGTKCKRKNKQINSIEIRLDSNKIPLAFEIHTYPKFLNNN